MGEIHYPVAYHWSQCENGSRRIAPRVSDNGSFPDSLSVKFRKAIDGLTEQVLTSVRLIPLLIHSRVSEAEISTQVNQPNIPLVKLRDHLHGGLVWHCRKDEVGLPDDSIKVQRITEQVDATP
jgi:hypothetical protein